jgi:guanine nucleotide exchange factor VAV
VAEIFLEFKEKFLLYGQFCAALPKAQQTLDAVCGKSDAVREEVARCEQVRLLLWKN